MEKAQMKGIWSRAKPCVAKNLLLFLDSRQSRRPGSALRKGCDNQPLGMSQGLQMVTELERGLHWAQLGLSEPPTSLSVPVHCPVLPSWLRRGCEDLFSPPSLVGYLSITFLEVFSLPGLNTTASPLVCFHRPLPYILSSRIPGHPFWRSSSSCLFSATEFGGEIGSLYLMLFLSLLNLSSFPGDNEYNCLIKVFFKNFN